MRLNFLPAFAAVVILVLSGTPADAGFKSGGSSFRNAGSAYKGSSSNPRPSPSSSSKSTSSPSSDAQQAAPAGPSTQKVPPEPPTSGSSPGISPLWLLAPALLSSTHHHETAGTTPANPDATANSLDGTATGPDGSNAPEATQRRVGSTPSAATAEPFSLPAASALPGAAAEEPLWPEAKARPGYLHNLLQILAGAALVIALFRAWGTRKPIFAGQALAGYLVFELIVFIMV
jgi:hypothetical protein